MQSAYDAFQEGNRLLASQNPHAAVIPLERARDLEPDKGSVRETLAPRLLPHRPLHRRRARNSQRRSRSSRSTTTPTSGSACA